MPNTTQIADLLYKKLLGIGTAQSGRKFYEETILGRPFVVPTQIWRDASLIPATSPGTTIGVVQQVTGYPLVQVVGATNSFTGLLFTDIIPFNYGDGTSYNYALYDSTLSPISFGTNDWTVDTEAGILMFNAGIPTNVPPYISFYRYSGTKGMPSTGSFALSGQNIGGATGIYSGTGINALQFKTLIGGSGIQITGNPSNNTLTFIVTGIAGGSAITTGSFVDTGMTGVYADAGKLTLTGSTLVTNLASTGSTLINNLASTGSTLAAWTGSTTNLYYPRSSNPSGFITGFLNGFAGLSNVSGIASGIVNNQIQFFGLSGTTGIYLTSGQGGGALILSTTGLTLSSATGNFVDRGQTGSFIDTGKTGQFAAAGSTGSFVTTSQTGNYVDRGQTGNFIDAGKTGQFYAAGNPSNYISYSSVGGVQTINITGSTVSGAVVLTGVGIISLSRSGQTITITGDISSLVTSSSTGQFIDRGMTGNFVTTSQTGIFVDNGKTGNYVDRGQTGNFIDTGKTGQFATATSVTTLNSWTGITPTLFAPIIHSHNYITGLTVSGSPSISGLITLTGFNGINVIISGNTINFALSGSTGSFITTSQTGNFVDTGKTGQFYASTNPNNYISNSGFLTGFNNGTTGLGATGIVSGLVSGYIQFYSLSGSTGLQISRVPTGGTLILSITGLVLSSSTGNFITTGQTGQFYTSSNPNGYATSGNLLSTGSNLQSQINTIVSWTGITTGIFYPLTGNPSGFLTGSGGYIRNYPYPNTGVVFYDYAGGKDIFHLENSGSYYLQHRKSFAYIDFNGLKVNSGLINDNLGRASGKIKLKADNNNWHFVSTYIDDSLLSKTLEVDQSVTSAPASGGEYCVITADDSYSYKFSLISGTGYGGTGFITYEINQTPTGSSGISQIYLIGNDNFFYSMKLINIEGNISYLIESPSVISGFDIYSEKITVFNNPVLTGGQNIGEGYGIISGGINNDLQVKSLIGGSGIQINESLSNDSLTLMVTGVNIRDRYGAGIYTFFKTINSGSTGNIFSLSNTYGAFGFNVSVVCDSSGYSVAKNYSVASKFGSSYPPRSQLMISSLASGQNDFTTNFIKSGNSSLVMNVVNTGIISGDFLVTLFLGGSPTPLTLIEY